MDFGMGWGKWALMAKAFGCKSYGAELSAERIAYAESNGISVLQWDEMPNQDFDFINTEQVFEHIPEPLPTLKHLASALKPTGLIKISVPTANNISGRLRRMDWDTPKKAKLSLNPVAPLEHINFYRRSSLVKMAEKAGLEEVQIPLRYQYQYATNWSNPKQIAKNIWRPIYRNILHRQNYVFFRKMPLTSGSRNPAHRGEAELIPMRI
ncbi:MAG: class I SAM-dependent methyltransferase [Caldilineaceae bacterium]